MKNHTKFILYGQGESTPWHFPLILFSDRLWLMGNDGSKGKEAVGRAAANLIEDGMVVGLGTGSTAHFFIAALGERCRQGLRIRGVATSEASLKQAQAEGIPTVSLDELSTLIDLDVDGADEIDHQKRMIKGGGGALVREKIIASTSKEMVVIVDSSKVVDRLGKFPLPVEIIPFGHKATIQKLRDLGYQGVLRRDKSGEIYVTDNHNYIYDIQFPQPTDDPERHDQVIQGIPGVVDTGFFFGLAGRVLVGHPDGKVKIL
jgi:ribose 5-phosphate isomerase A